MQGKWPVVVEWSEEKICKRGKCVRCLYSSFLSGGPRWLTADGRCWMGPFSSLNTMVVLWHWIPEGQQRGGRAGGGEWVGGRAGGWVGGLVGGWEGAPSLTISITQSDNQHYGRLVQKTQPDYLPSAADRMKWMIKETNDTCYLLLMALLGDNHTPQVGGDQKKSLRVCFFLKKWIVLHLYWFLIIIKVLG